MFDVYRPTSFHCWILTVYYDILFFPTKLEYLTCCFEKPAGRNVRERVAKVSWGVHHSKYMLLFLKGELIIVITTSNLSPQRSLDLSWVARFPKRENEGSNFGEVLWDFLIKQSHNLSLQIASAGGSYSKDRMQEMSSNRPTEWLLENVNIEDLNKEYDFSGALVDLVSGTMCCTFLVNLTLFQSGACFLQG